MEAVAGLSFVAPDPRRDAPFAVQWFASPHGKETLLAMGNPVHTITSPVLKEEEKRLRTFLQLEKEGKQLTWMLRMDGKTVGAAWINLERHGTVNAPNVHLMIGDASYRGKGIGMAAMRFMIGHARDALKADVVYSRHLVSNERIKKLNKKLGFTSDGEPYVDADGLAWQNVKLSLRQCLILPNR